MTQLKLGAVFMRGGTSKAVIFHPSELPPERDAWAPRGNLSSAIGPFAVDEGALCLAIACRDIRVGHPSGVTRVAAGVAPEGEDIVARSGTAYRTARRLFQGEALYRSSAA
jgi:2-methylaconitate cis-trans-isomerase PrpF